MGLGKLSTSALALATLNSIGALAASAPHCVGDKSQVCFSWGVPEAVIQSGSGNVYFQIRAPKTYEWAALGIGSQMRGAEIFLMYQDGAGNVTLSTRAGTDHIMPQYSKRSAELLAGSGVIGDEMIANIRCGDCKKADLKKSSNWISAWKVGNAINSKDTNADIDYHDAHSNFQIDLSQAAVSSDSNPFTSTDSGSNPSGSNPSSGGGSNNDSGSGSGGGNIVSGGSTGGPVSNALLYGHGILMTIVWVILYPAGALLMPFMGLGMGYVISHRLGIFWQNTHTRLGIMVCALMFLQPILGALHHANFKKQGRRGAMSHIHVWYGRALIILGIINGGLGLQLASSGMAFKIAYIVLSVVIAGPYFLSIPYLEMRKARASKSQTVTGPSSKGPATSAVSDEGSSR
ncbi:hypothetical protein NLG97_g7769 [Lecanicillium saksenae]|uniref:Uncharacterized protein n=1 Tax=Lecanicillium saksenae TaxID=468837 RepID=A0ACC1QMQ0_9HYPO|nr:hypothetical protein NLG97_g7769 [Lecanicillium saksenae]